jgi:hypothetical protein
MYLSLDIGVTVLIQLLELVCVFIQEIAEAEAGYLDRVGEDRRWWVTYWWILSIGNKKRAR